MSLTNQETDLRLLYRIRVGADDQAKEELIKKYIPMVKYIIRIQGFYQLEFEDLYQEGLIGLLKAVNEYDQVNYEVKFSSFAYICILRKIYNALKRHRRMKHYYYETIFFEQRDFQEARSIWEMIADYSFEPETILIEKLNRLRLQKVLRAYLSSLEYAVVFLYLQGLSCREIQKQLHLEAKVVDNARTRARMKLRRILHRYGSLLNPQLPLAVRKREDLYLRLKVI